MRLAEAERFLALFVDYEKQAAADLRQYNLERMAPLLDALGNPHRAFRSIHIAGTDGKGSTAAMLHHLLTRAGHKTGLYTSPHLSALNERIVINDQPLGEEAFVGGLRRAARALGILADESAALGRIERLPAVSAQPSPESYATVFELLTATAFLAFAEKRVDVAVIEVGLGGRLDCTNVITPLVSVITSIDYDHTERLGKTLPEIAREKLGIVKPGVPVVLGPQYHEEAQRFALRFLAAHDAKCEIVRDEWTWQITARSPAGYNVAAERRSDRTSHQFTVGLLGDHQAANAVTALAATRFLPADLRTGIAASNLADVRWPGRFELFLPVGGLEPVVLDCAHTPQGAFALRQTLDQLYPDQRVFVMAQLSDKQPRRFAELLIRPGDVVVATAASSPRSLPPLALADEIAAGLAEVYPDAKPNIHVAGDPLLALRKAAAVAPTATLVVTGSIYLVGEVRRILAAASAAELSGA